MASPNDILRTPQAAPYVGLAVGTLNKMRLTGDGPPFVRLTSRAVGYLRSDLDAFLASRRVRSTSDRGDSSATAAA